MVKSVIVEAKQLPEGSFYVTEVPYFDRVKPRRLGEFFNSFQSKQVYNGPLSDLLLNNKSTAVYHLSASNIGLLGEDLKFVEPMLLGVNYHEGHSEGKHKIVVQNIPQRKGPWVLHRPPGSEEKTFFLQDMVFPRMMPPTFNQFVDAPLKINKYFLHRGNPLEIFESFKDAGFSFEDKAMTEEYMKKIGYYC